MRLDCGLFVYCDNVTMDPQAFLAINQSSLVFDGRLVVDNNFVTNDPLMYVNTCIYCYYCVLMHVSVAGGTATKFKRKYHAPSGTEKYNARNIGAKLAASVLSLLDPVGEYETPPVDSPPVLDAPVAKGALLPGILRRSREQSANNC